MKVSKSSGISAALIGCVLGAMIATLPGASAEPMADRQVRPGLPAVSATATAPARVTMVGGPLLQVKVGPSQVGPGAWTFTLERRSGTSWERAGAYRTKGTLDEVSLPVTAGTYRVVVPAQHGYQATTSKPRAYAPTPDITVAGHGALELKVGPIRDWQVTLERKTDQGWSKVKTAKTRGLKRMVFTVDAGTYRVQTAANGRFPAFTSKPFEFVPQAPPGPIPYGYLDAAFSDAASVPTKKVRAATRGSSSSNCASVMSQGPNIGLKVATGVINYIPYVGGALSSRIDTQASNAQSNAEEACLSAQFATINAQLAYQESQIESLQNQLTSAESEISEEFVEAAKENVQEEQAPFYGSVETLAQCTGGGLFYDFMNDLDLWSGCYAPTSATIQGIATSSTFASQSLVVSSDQKSFSESLDNVAGNWVYGCNGSRLPPAPGQSGPDCQNDVIPKTGTQLTELQQALTVALNKSLNVKPEPGTPAMNLVPLYDDYNQYLVSYYQQSVVAIQAAFTMESLVNQLNYYNAGQDAPIDSLGLVPGTYYSFQDLQTALGSKPSATAQAQYYNRAQQALAQVYAARVNQLYQDTISYIVTDDPVGSQAWPSSATGNRVNANIDYASNVGTQVTNDSAAGGPQESTPLALLPPAATNGAQWTSNAVLYQYFGLRNAGTCYANLLQWNKDNGTAVQGKNGIWYPTATPSQSELAGGAYDRQCPPILTTSTGTAVTAPPTSSTLNSCATYAVLPGVQGGSGSCYDGNTLVPYYAAAGGLPELGSAVLTNLILCSASDPALTWFQVGSANAGNAAGLTLGDWALTCGNWAAPVGPGYSNGFGAFPGSSPPTSWGTTTSFTCGPVSISGNQSFSAYQNAASPNCSNGANATSIWGAAGYGVNQFTFNSFSVPGYYVSPNLVGLGGGGSPPAYIPPATATMGEYQAPLNIGGGSGNVNVTIDSSNCYSDSWWTGVSIASGCLISFAGPNIQKFGQDSFWWAATAGLAAFAVSLPNGGTGGAGGFSLPILVGTSAYSAGSNFTSNEISNWLEVWVNSGTSISQVGYYAPPSVPVPNGYSNYAIWQQNGYVTVADGSCWNINLGRTANNAGTISFNQVTPGSLCAS